MNNKIINLIFRASMVSLAASLCFFYFSILQNKADAAGGLSIGGRIISVAPPITAPPGAMPGPPFCAVGTSLVIITPYGGQGSMFCAPSAPPLVTSGPPITPASVGGQILGLFSTLEVVATPIGIVGTSL